MNREDVGRASGFSIEEVEGEGFRWSAFGPAGTRAGRAATREEAATAARSAERELTEQDPGERS